MFNNNVSKKHFLTVSEYNKSEKNAMVNIPNRIIECSSVQTMVKLGYPVSISNTKELQKYVDCMHEGRFDSTFDTYIKKLSIHEFDLIKEITKTVINNSNKNYSTPKLATASLIRSLIIFRMLKFAGLKKNDGVLEIGGGNGYLGALLACDGYRYISTDISQAFYLYQNHLMTELLKINEMVEGTNKNLNKLNDINSKLFIHIPWWKFYSNNEFFEKLKIKFIVTSHMLAETHSNSLRFILKFLKKKLIETNGSFIFEGWGSTVEREIFEVNKFFSDYGYVATHNHINASLYSPKESNVKNALDYSSVKIVNSNSKEELREKYHPQIFVDETEISKKILKNTSEHEVEQIIEKHEVSNFFNEKSPNNNLLSDDEKFLKYIEVNI